MVYRDILILTRSMFPTERAKKAHTRPGSLLQKILAGCCFILLLEVSNKLFLYMNSAQIEASQEYSGFGPALSAPRRFQRHELSLVCGAGEG